MKEYFSSLDENEIRDNKTFWKTGTFSFQVRQFLRKEVFLIKMKG